MNFEIKKSNVKGKEEITLIFSPSDNLERAFFNELFGASPDVEIKTVPNTEDIVITKKSI